MTYALAQDPQHEDLMTAKSHLTGEKLTAFATCTKALTTWLKK